MDQTAETQRRTGRSNEELTERKKKETDTKICFFAFTIQRFVIFEFEKVMTNRENKMTGFGGLL